MELRRIEMEPKNLIFFPNAERALLKNIITSKY